MDTGDDFATAQEKLTEYFDSKKNIEYEIYTFRQTRQNPGESMNAFHSRCVNHQILVNVGTSTRKLNRRLFYPVYHSVFVARLERSDHDT